MTDPAYAPLVEHYERCLATHGDSHRGVDWPDAKDAATRYRVMLELAPEGEPASLVDLGCGLGHLFDHLVAEGRTELRYRGLDVSSAFVDAARRRLPEVAFDRVDVLDPNAQWDDADYVVMNGVFTEKRELTYEAMFGFLSTMLESVWPKTRRGLAFNVMSKNVDWERDDLFHVSMDELTAFLSRRLSRNIVIRHDYRLYEYTAYVYR